MKKKEHRDFGSFVSRTPHVFSSEFALSLIERFELKENMELPEDFDGSFDHYLSTLLQDFYLRYSVDIAYDKKSPTSNESVDLLIDIFETATHLNSLLAKADIHHKLSIQRNSNFNNSNLPSIRKDLIELSKGARISSELETPQKRGTKRNSQPFYSLVTNLYETYEKHTQHWPSGKRKNKEAFISECLEPLNIYGLNESKIREAMKKAYKTLKGG